MASSLEDLTGLLASFLGERSEQSLTATVGVSGRHVHLSQGDLEALFGAGYELTPIKNLSQPGQFASKETVTLVGPKGVIERVRVLGPVRSQTQVRSLSRFVQARRAGYGAHERKARGHPGNHPGGT